MGKQTFQVGVEFIANINDLQSKIKTVTGDISKMGSTSGGTQVQQQFDSLTRSVEQLLVKAQQPIGSQAEFNKLTSELARAEGAYTSLLGAVQRMQSASDAKKIELLPADQQARIRSAEAALRTFEGALKSAGTSSKELRDAQRDLAKAQGTHTTASGEVRQYRGELEKARREVANLEAEQSDLGGQLGEATAKAKDLSTALSAAKRRKNNDDEVASLTTQLEAARGRAQELQGQFDAVGVSLTQARAKETQFNNLLTQATTKANTAKEAIRGIGTHMAGLNSGNTQQLQTAFDALRQKALELNQTAGQTVVSLEGIDAAATPENIRELTSRFAQLKSQGLDQANQSIERTVQSLQGKLAPALKNMRSATQQAEQAFQRFNARAQEVSQLKSQLTYFFSLTNSVYLLRAALQSAMDTIKELDQVMTEAAVVTDFSVQDMWEKLPTYTKEATKLGASTKELYEATTLYYQQGLKGNEVMEVGIETMKMARIASMDAEEATQAMTAALRGFNMEVNQTNAQRINDVYSKLAAITASDTEQIATAMTKTASIAASANMEFETTAALLAQIIETTQEAPETAGTAVKTIIARFSEVKSLKSQGKNKGEDDEGEEIDVNKIDKALKTVGISMDQFFAGTEGLDSVLMRLAEKWDTLDFETQRYIATMAAGSRQQSRFIAMMSDYARTQELVSAANNSAGASQAQFEKTLDSMEAKLNKLQNAWNEFTMGIANNELIKGAISAITALLEALNLVIETVGNFFGGVNKDIGETENSVSKLVKSVLSLGVAFAAIRFGKMGLEAAFGKISSGIKAKQEEADKKRQKQMGGVQKKDPGKTLSQGAVQASNSLKKGAKEAGEIFKSTIAEAGAVGAEGEALETEAAIAGEKQEAVAATGGENSEKIAAINAETTEKMVSLDAEFTEKQAALDAEIAEKFAGVNAEDAEAVAAWESEAAEAQAALNQEYAEQRAAIFAEDAETKAALAGEGAETQAGVTGEQAEKIAALDSETSEKIASLTAEFEEGVAGIEGEGAEAAAALQGESQEKIAALEQEYAEQLAAITGEEVEASAAITGENAELLAALKKDVGSLPTQGGGGGKGGSMMIWAAAIIASIAAIGAIVNGANKLADNLNHTSAEQIKELNDAKNSVEEREGEVAEKLKNFGSTKKNVQDLTSELGKLRKGTADWATKMHEVRKEVNGILTTFPELKEYTETVNGVTTLSDEGWQLYEQKLLEQQGKYEAISAGLSVQLQSVQSQQEAESLNINTSSISQEEQQNIQTGQQIGGWTVGAAGAIGGAFAGAKLLGALGSFAGPVGTVIGAVVGGILGTVVGGLIGGAGAEDGVSTETINSVALAAADYTVQGVDGEETAFSAETATPEQIKGLLASQGIDENHEDFQELYDYIAENGAEFDEHSQKMKQNEEALEQYTTALGEAAATTKGLKDQDVDAYGGIVSNLKGELQTQVDNEKAAILSTGIKYSTTETTYESKHKDLYKAYGEIMGYKTFNEDDVANLFGEDVEMPTYGEIINTVAQSRANDKILEQADYQFAQLKEGPAVTKKVMDKDLTYKDYTLDELKTINDLEGKVLGESELKKLKKQEALASINIVDRIKELAPTKNKNVSAFKDDEALQTYGSNSFASSLLMSDGQWTGEQKTLYDNMSLYRDTMNEYLYQKWKKNGGNSEDLSLNNEVGIQVSGGVKDIKNIIEKSKTFKEYKAAIAKNDKDDFYTPLFEMSQATFKEAYEYAVKQNQVDNKGMPSSLHDRLNKIDFQKEYAASQKKYGYTDEMVADRSFLSDQSIGTIEAYFQKMQAYNPDSPNGVVDYNAKGKTDAQAYDQIVTSFDTLAAGLKESNQLELLNVLLETDWTSYDDLTGLYEIAGEMYDLSDIDSENLNEFVQACKETGLAIQQVDFETLKTQLQETSNIIKKIDGLDYDEQFVATAEELQKILEVGYQQGENLRDEFINTADGYVYLGDAMTDLRGTLQENNKILLQQQTAALANAIQMGEYIESSAANKTNVDWTTANSWTNDEIERVIKKMAPSGIVANGKVDETKLAEFKGQKGNPFASLSDSALKKLLLGEFDWEANASVGEYVRSLVATASTNYLNLNTNRTQGTQTANDLTELTYSQMSGQDLVDMWGKSLESSSLKEGEKISFTNDSGEVVNGTVYQGQVKDAEGNLHGNIYKDEEGNWVQDSILGKVMDYKVSQQSAEAEVDGTTRSLSNQNSALSKNSDLIKAAIVDSKGYEKKLSNLSKTISDNSKALEKDKGSKEYQKALDRVTEVAQDAFGDGITREFVEKNLSLFQQWAEGGEGAAESIRTAIINNLSSIPGVTAEKLGQVKTIIGQLDGLSFDIYGHADASQLFTQLAQVMGSAESAAEAMKVLGYTVEWEANGETTMTIPDPNSETGTKTITVPNYSAVVTDGLGNVEDTNEVNYGDSGGGSEEEPWENSYDKFYNTYEKINALLREREKLERRYDKLLNNRKTSAKELIANAEEQLANLEEQRKTQEYLQNGKAEEISDYMSDNSKYNKYATFDEETGKITIDWDEINAVTDQEEGEAIEEYISKLEELRDQWQETEDNLNDIEDTVGEIRDQGKDEYFDLEGQIIEALEGERQDEIDALNDLNDAITDTNTKLLEAMQTQIDEYRQARDNAETEEELSDKQRKIAYLSQDTSGANALEILQLQEELDEATEDYTDTLIDQKISKLQDQNDAAAEQRQEQIDLMRAQLDYDLENGVLWQQAYDLMSKGIDEKGIKIGSGLWKLLAEQGDYASMSNLEKLKWAEELNDTVAQAVQWLKVGNSTESLLASGEINKGDTIKFTTADGKQLSGKVDKDGNITVNGKTYKDVYRNWDGSYTTDEKYKGEEESNNSNNNNKPKDSSFSVGDYVKVSKGAIFAGGETFNESVRQSGVISGKKGAFKILKNKGDYYYIGRSWTEDGVTGKIHKKYLTKYKTGGLADFTGPAWLDGTKSKPEYILNAEQTKAFFTLVDVLQGLKEVPKNSSTTQNTGDNTYDIDINVESIGSDYDVDQLADRVKSLINQDARYRNNNTAGAMR